MPTLTPRPAPAPAPTDGPAASADGTARPSPERERGQPADPQKFPVLVRPSAIDGLGAFAGAAIPARRKIGEIRGDVVSTKEAHARARVAEREGGRIFMIALSERKALDASASSDPLRHANHACEPNTVLKVEQGRVAFYAIRDIAQGEELTARYGPTHHGGRLQCRCGSPRCIGVL